jgi:signal transduction histidine kinase
MLEILEIESIKSYKQINNFLEQSARFASEVTYDFKLCDLNELVSKAVVTNDAPATKKSQTIKLQKESEPLLVNADANKIIEAIDNLINNSIKFSSANTQILIKLVKENEKALLQITDQGQGLTNEDKALLFKRYAKLSAVPTGDELSSGMGLWMTKEIIDAHNGKIEATSAGKNLGTTFRIELNLHSN